MKGKISRNGYKSNSPDKNNDFNIIPSNLITMKGVDHPVVGIDDKGEMQFMIPGQEYKFGGSKVLEIPIKDVNMKKSEFYPFFMNLGGIPGLDYAQDGMEIKAAGKIVKATDVEQKLAKQYHFENLPGITERNAWNDFLKHVQSQYPINSEQAKTLNYGKAEDAQKKFNELVTGYNTDPARLQALKAQYAKVSKSDQFDKTITEDQFIKAREVNQQMITNAQKFYGQQTAKDVWFGSETAQTFYPTISGMAQAYPGAKADQIAQVNKNAAGKYAPVTITPYGSTATSDYKGAAVIKGYDASGNPIIDYNTTKTFTPDMAANVYFDKNYSDANMQKRFAPYLPQQQKGGTIDKNFFSTFLENHFKTKEENADVAPQGHDTDSIVDMKKDYFMKCLRENVAKHMVSDEVKNISDFLNNGGAYKAQDGTQINLIDPNDPTKAPPVNTMFDYYTGPFGNNNVQTPDYVTQEANKYPVFNTDPMQQGTPSNLNLTPRGDIDEIAYNKYMADNMKKAKNAQTTSNVATGVMAGMNLFSNTADYIKNRDYQKKLKDQLSAENVFSNLPVSRGDYDINSGAFRPNAMTPPSYKKGGQYTLDDTEIDRLKKLGYQIEIVE